jgi:uncharacterized alkaline shock family protein YloU
MTDVADNGATRGTTSVDDEVLEKIAAAAARTVPGVTDLGGDVSRFFDNIFNRVGLDQVGDATRGVNAKVTGTAAEINVVLVIAAGSVVADVTEAVRVAVIEAVEKYGLTVSAVNVKVDDIEVGGGATSV